MKYLSGAMVVGLFVCFGWLIILDRSLTTLNDNVASRADFIKLQGLVDKLIVEAKTTKRSDVTRDGWNFTEYQRRNTQPLVRAWRPR